MFKKLGKIFAFTAIVTTIVVGGIAIFYKYKESILNDEEEFDEFDDFDVMDELEDMDNESDNSEEATRAYVSIPLENEVKAQDTTQEDATL